MFPSGSNEPLEAPDTPLGDGIIRTSLVCRSKKTTPSKSLSRLPPPKYLPSQLTKLPYVPGTRCSPGGNDSTIFPVSRSKRATLPRAVRQIVPSGARAIFPCTPLLILWKVSFNGLNRIKLEDHVSEYQTVPSFSAWIQ